MIDEFIDAQRNFATAIAAAPTGPIGGRMYRSLAGLKTVLVSQFESLGAQSATMQSAEFTTHLEKMRAMVQSASPDLYEEAYTFGQFK
jgi:hypothetical protein